jgi:hypothetical protein
VGQLRAERKRKNGRLQISLTFIASARFGSVRGVAGGASCTVWDEDAIVDDGSGKDEDADDSSGKDEDTDDDSEKYEDTDDSSEKYEDANGGSGKDEDADAMRKGSDGGFFT